MSNRKRLRSTNDLFNPWIVPELEAALYPFCSSYAITKLGDIWSKKSGSWAPIKGTSITDVNVRVRICIVGPDGRRFQRYRSRVVWESWCGPILPGHEIDHKNGKSSDDRLENLQSMERSEHRRKGHQSNPDAALRAGEKMGSRIEVTGLDGTKTIYGSKSQCIKAEHMTRKTLSRCIRESSVYKGRTFKALGSTSQDEEDEEWRPVALNVYVSSLGRVKTVFGDDRGMRITRGSLSEEGYLKVSIHGAHTLVHQLVLQAFLPRSRSNQTTVNHKDHDRTNNRLDNLEWASPHEQVVHAKGRKVRATHQKTLQVLEWPTIVAANRCIPGLRDQLKGSTGSPTVVICKVWRCEIS